MHAKEVTKTCAGSRLIHTCKRSTASRKEHSAIRPPGRKRTKAPPNPLPPVAACPLPFLADVVSCPEGPSKQEMKRLIEQTCHPGRAGTTFRQDSLQRPLASKLARILGPPSSSTQGPQRSRASVKAPDATFLACASEWLQLKSNGITPQSRWEKDSLRSSN